MRELGVSAWAAGVALGAGVIGLVWAEPPPPAAAKPETAAAKRAGFPAAWVGHWRGPAQVIRPDGQTMEFTTELIVKPTDDPARWQWTIIYDGAAGKQERAYELIVRDAAKGRYAIDEKQGIVIESALIGDTMFSQFVVQGNRITTREKLEGAGTPAERISVEMITTLDGKPETSGGKEGIPEVHSHRPVSLQRASLTRVEEAKK